LIVWHKFGGHLQLNEYAMWRFKENEEGEDMYMAEAGRYSSQQEYQKEKRKTIGVLCEASIKL